jgi:(2Fe-2S) ferredoxin
MMTTENNTNYPGKFKKHIFVCTNQKEAPKKCCGESNGMALVEAFKQEITSRQLQTEVRAQKSGCLDVCGFGPSVVVYPDGIFYGKVTLDDVAEIVESHICNNIPVERLKLNFK